MTRPAAQGFLAHIRGLREHGINTCFSVGVAITEPIREAIRRAIDKSQLYGMRQPLH